jgi:hypothetical protein
MKLEIKDCKHPWKNLQIMATGEVRVCCWSICSLGNLNNESLDKIWDGTKLKELREYVSNNKLHSFCTKAPCPYVQGYINNK